MLSRKSKYGMKALLALADTDGERPVLAADLADREGLPKKFLEAILLELKRHGVVQSRKGPGGGYRLARPAGEITLGRVIRVLDGPLALIPCVSQTAYAKCDECVDEQTCGIRLVMKDVRDSTAAILDGTSLATVAARVRTQARTRRTPRSKTTSRARTTR